ncbi:hypothetical protein MSAN_02402200 [Mycena sanguinolenta]|uniref:F-box domain-containing protein n=1 Tax=Mycena sanguinolenta TaxID=230812 RepID=A0A8H7CE55_9AGAR|nr:hypothetical protein MSAN_02402200 [Mycena sanguinolenta]
MNLATLLRTNQPPAPLQEAEINRLISSATTELSQLENTIDVVSRILRDLQFRRSQLRESAVGLKGVISAIRRIPPEILAQIFLHCRDHSLEGYDPGGDPGEPPMPNNIEYCSINAAQAPLLLTHVSSGWRTVALDTPSLWNTVCLPITSGVCPFIGEIVPRSRLLPLSISFSTSYRLSRERPEGQFLRDLWELGNRVRDVRLHLGGIDIQCPIPVISRSFPILEALSIDLYAGRTLTPVDTSLSTLLDLFQDAPLLQSFNLEVSFPPPQSILTAHFAWAQLRSLSISVPIPHIACGILIQCTHLEQGYVGGLVPSSAPPQLLPRTLSYLHHLTVAAEEKRPLVFFDLLSLPKLETLYLKELNLPSGSLKDLLHRSLFNLQHLTLAMVVMELDDLVEFLQLIPGLRTLCLIETCIEDGVFQAFRNNPTFTLPALTKLSLHRRSTSSLDGIAMVDTIQWLAKYKNVENSQFPSIVTVEIHIEGFRFTGDVEDDLACMVSTGFLLDTCVKHRTPEFLGDRYFSDSDDDASHENSEEDGEEGEKGEDEDEDH